jgi:methyl-accepting chemotaxis protein
MPLTKLPLLFLIVFSLTTTTQAGFFAYTKLNSISFTKKEILGNTTAQIATQTLGNLVVHQAALMALTRGVNSLQNDSWKARQSAISRGLSALQAIQTKHGQTLEITEKTLENSKKNDISLQSIRRKWEALNNGLPNAQALKECNELVQNLSAFVSFVADKSNLVLDPDLDSYYLMDVSTLAIPQTIQRANQLLPLLLSSSSSKDWSLEERIQLGSFHSTFAQVDLPRIKTGIDTAISEDPNHYGSVPGLSESLYPLFTKYERSTEKLSLAAQSASLRGEKADTASVFEFVQNYIQSASQLSENSSQRLQNMLEKRLSSHQTEFNLGLAGIFLIFATSCFYMFRLSRKIAKDLKKLSHSLEHESQTTKANSGALNESSKLVSHLSLEQHTHSSLMERYALKATSAASNISAIVEEKMQMALQARQVIQAVVAKTRKGQNSTQTLSRMAESMRAMEEKIAALLPVIDGIVSKTNVIHNIGRKTEVLSINASIEAARAGVAGKSFAVVAEEVGQLAQTTGKASEEIASVLTEARGQMAEVIQETVAELKTLRQVSGEIVFIFESISKAAEEIDQGIQNIHEGTEKELSGVVQLSETVAGLKRIINENTDLAVNTEQAAQSLGQLATLLNGQSEQLFQTSGVLKNVVGGDRSPPIKPMPVAG